MGPDLTPTTACEGQSRNWCFTRQATAAESQIWNSTASATITEPFTWHLDSRVVYLVYQIEKAPKTGQLHIQGMISFKNSCRFSAIKALIGNAPHIEKMRGTPDENHRYCTKAETRVFGPWEHGERPKGQGKKKVTEQIVEAVTTGKRTSEMIRENPSMVLHERAIKFCRFAFGEDKSDRQSLGKLRVIVSYGTTGTGKTFSAINIISQRNYFKVSASSLKGGKIWFDGYQDQPYLILDDWDGTCCSISYLKTLLDVYRLSVENKGGQVWAQWHTVIITSNIHPNRWFLNFHGEEDTNIVGPLRRRITEIRHYIQERIYQLEDWDGNVLGDQVEEPNLPQAQPPQQPNVD